MGRARLSVCDPSRPLGRCRSRGALRASTRRRHRGDQRTDPATRSDPAGEHQPTAAVDNSGRRPATRRSGDSSPSARRRRQRRFWRRTKERVAGAPRRATAARSQLDACRCAANTRPCGYGRGDAACRDAGDQLGWRCGSWPKGVSQVRSLPFSRARPEHDWPEPWRRHRPQGRDRGGLHLFIGNEAGQHYVDAGDARDLPGGPPEGRPGQPHAVPGPQIGA